MNETADTRRFAPATLRNRGPILDALAPELPGAGTVLEVASGTGEHVVHFARHLPHLEWQPSDPSPEARRSIAAWAEHEGLGNVRAPLDLDVMEPNWAAAGVAATVCVNMVHISPWQATIGLMRHAARLLPADGLLYLYGPFRQRGVDLAPGNRAFDADLRERDPRWGLRELDDVIACGAEHGLGFVRSIDMPANNLSVLFRNGQR